MNWRKHATRKAFLHAYASGCDSYILALINFVTESSFTGVNGIILLARPLFNTIIVDVGKHRPRDNFLPLSKKTFAAPPRKGETSILSGRAATTIYAPFLLINRLTKFAKR